MKKKLLIIFVILVFLVLLGPRIYILSVATWQYYHADIVCSGREPTPPEGLGNQIPLLLYEVRPYTVITDRGHMYPGDEYEVTGEGSWYGIATLIWAGRDGAVFVATFVANDPVKGYSRLQCRWFVPIGDYR